MQGTESRVLLIVRTCSKAGGYALKTEKRLLVEIIEASRRIQKLELRGMETSFSGLVWHLIDGNNSHIVAGGNHSIRISSAP